MLRPKFVVCATTVITAALPCAAKAATFSVLLNFGCCSAHPPIDPVGEPLVDSQGNIFVVTQGGGNFNLGTVDRVSPSGHLTILYEFPVILERPAAGVVFNSNGNLVGTSEGNSSFQPSGGAYSLSSDGEKHSIVFSSADGPSTPVSALAADGRGNMISTSLYGGAYGAGTIFRLGPQGKLAYYSLPYEYARVASGFLTVDSVGNIYGASDLTNDLGGAIFRLSTTGKFTAIYNFSSFNGCYAPTAGYVINSSGTLIGTTTFDSLYDGGCIFSLAPNGTYSVVYQFSSSNSYSSGAGPNGDLTADAAGNIYGTTQDGGAYGDGVVFELSPNGTETVLHSFSGSDGTKPSDGVVLASDGNLYGVTYHGGANGEGVLYKINLTN